MATKTKTTFKQKVSNAYGKAKGAVKNTANSIKKSTTNYANKVRQAYDTGYARGYEDAYRLPDVAFANTSGALGYKHGAKDRKYVDKVTAKYKRIKSK